MRAGCDGDVSPNVPKFSAVGLGVVVTVVQPPVSVLSLPVTAAAGGTVAARGVAVYPDERAVS